MYPSPRPLESPSSRLEYAMLGLSLAVLAGITLPLLDRQGFWFDEVYSVETAASGASLRDVLLHYENNMALYYALLCGWLQFGTGEAWTRSLSVAFALATIPVCHGLARRLFDRRTAIVADALLVGNACFIFYAVEARSYSLVVLLGTVATWLFVRALDRDEWRTWGGYAVVIAAGVYAHYLSILIVAVHGLVFLLPSAQPRPWLKLVCSAALAVVLVSPLALFRPALSSGQVDWLARPGGAELAGVYTELAGGRAFAGATLAAGVALVAALFGWRSVLTRDQVRSAVLVLAWFIVPTAVGFTFSIFVKPLFLPRYFILSVPAGALVLAAVLARWRTGWILAVVVPLVGWSAYKAVQPGVTHGAAWREATARIAAHAGPREAVLCYPFHVDKPVSYYLRRAGAPDRLLPQMIASGPFNPGGGAVDPDPDLAIIRRLAENHDRVWVFVRPAYKPELNRGWFPEIASALETRLPHREVETFAGPRNLEPVKLYLFQREPKMLDSRVP